MEQLVIEEPPALAQRLQSLCAAIAQLSQQDTLTRLAGQTKAEILQEIKGASRGGRRITASWSKSALISALLAIHREQLEREQDQVLRSLQEYGIPAKTALAFVQQPAKRERKSHA